MFSCLGRGEGLYGEPNFDSRLFRRYFNIPLSGFFCNGEIGGARYYVSTRLYLGFWNLSAKKLLININSIFVKTKFLKFMQENSQQLLVLTQLFKVGIDRADMMLETICRSPIKLKLLSIDLFPRNS